MYLYVRAANSPRDGKHKYFYVDGTNSFKHLKDNGTGFSRSDQLVYFVDDLETSESSIRVYVLYNTEENE